MTEEEIERWVDTMPILAAICWKRPDDAGEFVRTTEWGALYLKGDYYTLVTEENDQHE